MQSTSFRAFAAALLCVAVAGCGGGQDTDESASDTAGGLDTTTSEATSAPASPPPTSEASLTVDDIDRWQRGMEGELAAVREAASALKEAKTAEDTMNAIFAANEMSTRPAGARAAGLDEERYGVVRARLSELTRNLAPLEQEMDVSKMPAEAVTQLKAARDTALMRMSGSYDPALVEALRPRAAALRKQELDLTAERLRAAGMVR